MATKKAWARDCICPACGEDVTDSPDADLPLRGAIYTECANCTAPVAVECRIERRYRVETRRTEPTPE